MRTIAAIALLTTITTTQLHAADIDSLSWMTGSWAGAIGENVLEETWNHPKAGTIGGVIRMTGAQGTDMIELIVIAEEEDGLTLRMQQFSPQMEPRFASAQVMKLISQGDKTATFEAITPGGLKKLTYTRVADDKFTLDGEMADGNEFKAELTAN